MIIVYWTPKLPTLLIKARRRSSDLGRKEHMMNNYLGPSPPEPYDVKRQSPKP